MEIYNRTTGNARDDDSLEEMLTLYMERSDRSWKEIKDALNSTTIKSSEFQNNKKASRVLFFYEHTDSTLCKLAVPLIFYHMCMLCIVPDSR